MLNVEPNSEVRGCAAYFADLTETNKETNFIASMKRQNGAQTENIVRIGAREKSNAQAEHIIIIY